MDRERQPEPTILSRVEDGATWITLNRPDRYNAFAGSMRDELANAIEQAGADAAVRVIVVVGAGAAFCAGADVDSMMDLLDRSDEQAFRANVEAGARVVRAIATAPKPVIAAVNGVAVGAGAALAMACDLRIAASGARLGFTFNRIGLHPDWGTTHFLPRLAGAGRAADLILSARLVEAGEAQRLGLLNQVVTAEEHEMRVRDAAREMAGRPPIAVAAAKRSLLEAAGGLTALDDALRRETEAQLLCFRSRDVREGIAAFREKRPPRFSGH